MAEISRRHSFLCHTEAAAPERCSRNAWRRCWRTNACCVPHATFVRVVTRRMATVAAGAVGATAAVRQGSCSFSGSNGGRSGSRGRGCGHGAHNLHHGAGSVCTLYLVELRHRHSARQASGFECSWNGRQPVPLSPPHWPSATRGDQHGAWCRVGYTERPSSARRHVTCAAGGACIQRCAARAHVARAVEQGGFARCEVLMMLQHLCHWRRCICSCCGSCAARTCASAVAKHRGRTPPTASMKCTNVASDWHRRAQSLRYGGPRSSVASSLPQLALQ